MRGIINLEQLDRELKILKSDIENGAVGVQRKMALNIGRHVSQENPEDTGYSEYNWQAGAKAITETSGSYIPRSKFYVELYHNGSSLQKMSATISSLDIKPGMPIYIGNAVPYLSTMPHSPDKWVDIGIDKAIKESNISLREAFTKYK